uniref:Uncharacterized protein n=1 Tax=Tetranychus urticae TaxID=32264 RepID=T1KQQ3_TETUR
MNAYMIAADIPVAPSMATPWGSRLSDCSAESPIESTLNSKGLSDAAIGVLLMSNDN